MDYSEAYPKMVILWQDIHILALVIMVCPHFLLSDCPRLCECRWTSGKESAICTKANLTSIPLSLDAGTQLLNLTSNNLVIIKDSEFSSAGLLNLQKVFLVGCRLKVLEPRAFKGLINLVELDLSLNSLGVVPSHVFHAIQELRELKLVGNPIRTVGNNAFREVPQLIRLELTDCKIAVIAEKAFNSLESSLEWLKLDNNRLTEINSSSFTILTSLHGLELAGNPWNCSCRLKPLREWMLHHNIPFGIPPSCRYPIRLMSKTWEKLDVDDFACAPATVALNPKPRGTEGRNVTMSCHVEGIPQPKVRWMLRNRIIANVTSTSFSSKLYSVQLGNNLSDLTILDADVQDTGTYTCSAENRAGRAEASFGLAVSRKPLTKTFSKEFLLTSVVAGTLLVLSVSLAVLVIHSCRRKHALRCHNRPHKIIGDEYEKIEMNQKVEDSKFGAISEDKRKGDYRLISSGDSETETDRMDDEVEDGFRTPARQGNCNRGALAIPLVDTDFCNRNQEANRGIRPSSTSTSGTYKDPSTTSAYQGYITSPIRDKIDLTCSSGSPLPALSEDEEKRPSTKDLYCTMPRNMAPPPAYHESHPPGKSYINDLRSSRSRFNSSSNIASSTSSSSSATPLLDFSNLDNRVLYRPVIVPQAETSLSGSEDFHVTQLERFLEEYRNLQEEMQKLKLLSRDKTETKFCDNGTAKDANSPYFAKK